MTSEQWNEEAKTNIRLLPKYGHVTKTEGPEALPAYIPLLEKYTLDLLEICEDSEKLSKELVFNWIKDYMLKKKESFPNQIQQAVDYF